MAYDTLGLRFLLDVVKKLDYNRSYMGTNFGDLGLPDNAMRQGGPGLFPVKDVMFDELTWDVISAENQLAGVYAVDGEIKPGDDPNYETLFADIVRIGSSRIVPESAVRTLRDPGMIGTESGMVASFRKTAERKVRERLEWCNSEVNSTIEYLCMNALQGSLTWPATGPSNPPGYAQSNFTLTWSDVTTGNISDLTGGTAVAWSTVATANAINDLEVIAQAFADKGIPVDGNRLTMICSSKVLSYLRKSTLLQGVLQYTNPGFLDITQTKTFIEREFGHTIIPYDALWSYRTYSSAGAITENWTRFLDENKVIIFPSYLANDLGDLATSPSMANDWNTGKFTFRKENQNPWNVEIGVGINAFPRFKRPNAVCCYTVNA